MENVNLFTQDFCQSKVLRHRENCNKTAYVANDTIFISINTLIPL